MFEGYSLRAHQVLILARLKAGQRGADTLGTEDLLVALIIEDQGGCFKALSGLPAHRNSPAQRDPWPHQPFLPPDRANDLLARVEALCTRSQPVSAASDMSVSEGVMRAFAGAAGLSGELQQNEVEPLHLLAAIVGDEASRVAQVLRDAGITREKVVKAIREEATAVSKERPMMVERVGVAAGPRHSIRSASARSSWNAPGLRWKHSTSRKFLAALPN